jgi:hypothetical protein
MAVETREGVLTKEVVVAKTANFTVTPEESGTVYLINTANIVATLPAASATLRGAKYTFIVTAAGLSVAAGFTVTPAAADAIAGAALTSVDSQSAQNSGATDAEGDTLTVVCDAGDAGEQGWYITQKIGIWAKV